MVHRHVDQVLRRLHSLFLTLISVFAAKCRAKSRIGEKESWPLALGLIADVISALIFSAKPAAKMIKFWAGFILQIENSSQDDVAARLEDQLASACCGS